MEKIFSEYQGPKTYNLNMIANYIISQFDFSFDSEMKIVIVVGEEYKQFKCMYIHPIYPTYENIHNIMKDENDNYEYTYSIIQLPSDIYKYRTYSESIQELCEGRELEYIDGIIDNQNDKYIAWWVLVTMHEIGHIFDNYTMAEFVYKYMDFSNIEQQYLNGLVRCDDELVNQIMYRRTMCESNAWCFAYRNFPQVWGLLKQTGLI